MTAVRKSSSVGQEPSPRGRGLREFGTGPPRAERGGSKRSPDETSTRPLGTGEQDPGELRGRARRARGRSPVELEGGARGLRRCPAGDGVQAGAGEAPALEKAERRRLSPESEGWN